MGFAEEHSNLDYLLTEFADGARGVKLALADGRIDPTEVVDVIRSIDPGLADYIGKLLVALKGIYPEVKSLADGGPWVMMTQAAPYFASKLMQVFQ